MWYEGWLGISSDSGFLIWSILWWKSGGPIPDALSIPTCCQHVYLIVVFMTLLLLVVLLLLLKSLLLVSLLNINLIIMDASLPCCFLGSHPNALIRCVSSIGIIRLSRVCTYIVVRGRILHTRLRYDRSSLAWCDVICFRWWGGCVVICDVVMLWCCDTNVALWC